MSTRLIEQLYKELKSLEAQKEVGPRVMGPGGLFGVPGLERDVISTRIDPEGVAGILPARGTNTMYPLFPYITGWTAPVGDMPAYDEECPDAPVAGAPKSCLETAQFGRAMFQTRTVDITTLGEVINRGDFRDLRFVNDPLSTELASMLPNMSTDEATFFGSEVLERFLDVGISFKDYIVRILWSGTGTGAEPPGLEKLVVLNHYDAQTGELCEALRSDIRDFEDVDVTTAAGAAAMVTMLVDVVRNARYKASRMNFGRVEWVLAMKQHLFQELADVWPCSYMVSRCEVEGDSPISILGSENINLRRQMREGSYLLIDDMPVTVVTDDGLPEEKLGNEVYSSDIYLLPLTVLGGRPVLYWEYFDYTRGASKAIREGRLSDIFWTDGGRYLWTRQNVRNGCISWQAETRFRIILRTPQLAARIMNVTYSVAKHYRTHDPIYTSNFVNGGVVAGRPNNPWYNNWNNLPE